MATNERIRMVVTAASIKQGRRCVAGIIVDGPEAGSPVRPVGPGGGPLAEEACSVTDRYGRRVVRPADIVELTVAAPAPDHHQIENRPAVAVPWRLVGRMGWDDLVRWADDDLWDARSASAGFTRNRIRPDDLAPADGSLRLVEVADLTVDTFPDPFDPARSRVRATFTHAGTRRALSVTDPALGRPTAPLQVGRALVTVSCTPPFSGWCYLLCAAVMTPRTVGRGAVGGPGGPR